MIRINLYAGGYPKAIALFVSRILMWYLHRYPHELPSVFPKRLGV